MYYLSKVTLQEANLQEADLQEVDLQGANLGITNLQNSVWTLSDIAKVLLQLK